MTNSRQTNLQCKIIKGDCEIYLKNKISKIDLSFLDPPKV